MGGYEVEVKIPLVNVKNIETALLKLGATKTNTETHVDVYFNHPSRNFGETDEALRIRNRSNIVVYTDSSSNLGSISEITYKGPKVDKTTKTRIEIAFGIDSYESASSLLTYLGFQEAATVTKNRTFFQFGNITLSIDDVESVGTFLELEQIVTSKDLIPAAREAIFALLEDLGLRRKDSIRESYLELILRKKHH
ncbi:MAG: class IV adenylate cyclase [Candidatus Thorarchaeota archaeon]